MKKIFATALALCAAWTGAFAADGDTFNYGGLTYNVISEADHTCEVGDNADDNVVFGEIVIPEQVQYGKQLYTVTRIGKRAFYWNRKVTSMQLPNTLTTICQEGLMRCDYITELVIPNSVTNIETRGVYGCERLKTLTLGTGLTEIVSETFSGCGALEVIDIPDNITTLATCSFNFCGGVKALKLGKGLKTIGVNAFSGLSSLESVSIPANVTSIANEAFTQCAKLKNVTFEAGTTTLYLGEMVFGDSNWIVGAGMPSVAPLVNVSIYRDYTCSASDIDGLPFSKKVKLENITIGTKVKSVAANTFAGCTAIMNVTSEGAVPPQLAQSAFDTNIYQTANLCVPTNAVSAYESNQSWNRFMKIKGVEIAVDPENPDNPNDPNDPSSLDDLEFWFNPASITLEVGKYADLNLESTDHDPAIEVNLDYLRTSYTSSDPDVATVTGEGKVHAIAPGKCTVTYSFITSISGVEIQKSAQCEIEVIEEAGVDSVETDYESGAYYNLNGVRSNSPVRGIYIINGKKVVVNK